jgi:dipeptidase E
MKLYLSSYLLGSEPSRLVQLLGGNKSAALIRNAADVYGDGLRPEYLKRHTESLASIGITAIDVDLRHYFGKPQELRNILSKVGLLWVTGGNTFTLRRAMRESGLDKMLPEILESENIVYGGFSAGACVLCPSLRGIHLGDEPEKVATGYPSEVIWDGIGLIKFYIVPHYRSPHPETEAMEKVSEYYKTNGLEHYNLQDGQAIVVDGSQIEVVGHCGVVQK